MSIINTLKRSCPIICRSALQIRLQQTGLKPKLKTSHQDVCPVFRKAGQFVEKPALRDAKGTYTYGNIFLEAKELSEVISRKFDGRTGERVLFLCKNDANYVITQWAIWMSGQIAIPLSSSHPKNLLLYLANDSRARLIITIPEMVEVVAPIGKNTGIPLHVLDDNMQITAMDKMPKKLSDMEAGLSPSFYNKENAMILYTSGTTGNPKGVVLTHRNLFSQVNTLLGPWKWSPTDIILHTLPLNHVHGIVNALLCPHYIGAKCVMLPKFNSNAVWSYFLGVNIGKDIGQEDRKISVFMGVPTMYTKLIEEYDSVFRMDSKMCEHIKNTLKGKFRLFVSGSAPLSRPVYDRWLEISGHRLLERFGMTEIGMCLSHEYDSEREPGYVGVPLPGVSVRLAVRQEDDEGDYATIMECTNQDGEIKITKDDILASDDVVSGELLVKGDNVFKEYWNRPEATQAEFTLTGWFKTGDIAEYSFSRKQFKLLGRKSVDIIKSGGFKISALEVETHIHDHPNVVDCAVVGIPDQVWGEKVVALIVPKDGKEITLDELKQWTREKVAEYAVPKEVRLLGELPKNAMGKVNKKELVKMLAELK